jgi:hypothetical protein
VTCNYKGLTILKIFDSGAVKPKTATGAHYLGGASRTVGYRVQMLVGCGVVGVGGSLLKSL